MSSHSHEADISGMTNQAPIIVIGMHRSGTTMLSKMLRGMGVFMGWKRQAEDEALFFLKQNEWLLKCAGGTWICPAPVRDLIIYPEIRSLFTDRIEMNMATPRILSYMGPKNMLRYGSIKKFSAPFGWKDPRSTFTLPLWTDIFPNARVIHVRRNGVDVASSLKERAIQRVKRYGIRNARDKRQYRHWIRPVPRFLDAPGVLSLEFALSVWSEHVTEARKHIDNMGDQGLEIEFEDLLLNPDSVLSTVASFCQLDVPQKTLNGLASTVNKDRAFGYLRNSELCEFADRMHDELATHGYGSVRG